MANDEVMTPVSTHEALSLAEIHVLRQISDNLASQGRQLERMNEKVDDVRERVIGLEKSGYDKRLEALKGDLTKALERIDTLESQRDQVKGAAPLWTWLSKNAPWLFAGIAAFVAGWGIKHP